MSNTIRERAKHWAQEALHFDEASTREIHAAIDAMPLTLPGLPYCPACESVLCGACGDCHGWDVQSSDPSCPNDHETTGHACVMWWQALKSVITAQRHQEEQL